MLGAGAREGSLAVAERLAEVALMPEVQAHELADVRLVFDDQHPDGLRAHGRRQWYRADPRSRVIVVSHIDHHLVTGRPSNRIRRHTRPQRERPMGGRDDDHSETVRTRPWRRSACGGDGGDWSPEYQRPGPWRRWSADGTPRRT